MILLTFTWCKDGTKEATATTASEETVEVSTPQENNIKIHPISHATMVLEWNDTTLYVDPVGGAERLRGLNHPI